MSELPFVRGSISLGTAGVNQTGVDHNLAFRRLPRHHTVELRRSDILKRHCDILIVGAGPAGLACAGELAGSGASVVVLEQGRRIGPKNCAGALSRLMPADLVPPSAFRFDEQLIEIAGKGHRLHLETPRFTVSRETLASYQLAKIPNGTGVEFLIGNRARLIDRHTVATGNGGELSADSIVGADGSLSVVRRFLGLPTGRTLGIYREVRAVSLDYTLILDAARYGSAYLWSFPHRDRVNIGMYFDPARLNSIAACRMLDEEIARRFPGVPAGPLTGGWVEHRYAGVEHDGTYLIGDAAGLALRATGEGISTAVVSGREVGRRLKEKSYAMPELVRMLSFKRKQERLFSLLERAPRLQDHLYRLFIMAKRLPGGQRLLEG